MTEKNYNNSKQEGARHWTGADIDPRFSNMKVILSVEQAMAEVELSPDEVKDDEIVKAKLFEFVRSLINVELCKDIEMTHDEEDRLVLCLEGLYDLFDKNGDSKVSKKELVSGLVILCSDDKHDKARTSFKLFDLNGDSAIDIEEMTAYLKSVFQIVYHTDPRMEIEMECDAETLARRTYFVLCCFHSLTHLLTRSINLSIIRYGRARIRGGRS